MYRPDNKRPLLQGPLTGTEIILVALAQLKPNTPVAPDTRSVRPPRPPIKKRILARDRTQICELYQSGLSFAEVAEQTGVARSTAMRIVRAAGIEVRPWGRTYRN